MTELNARSFIVEQRKGGHTFVWRTHALTRQEAINRVQQQDGELLDVVYATNDVDFIVEPEPEPLRLPAEWGG